MSHLLLDNKLVDEDHFWIFPTIAGAGTRLFEVRDASHLELLDTTTFKSGIVVHSPRPALNSPKPGDPALFGPGLTLCGRGRPVR
ncbi:hypothetical protein [Nocardia sp. NPDC057440]|uniref:hypothetical protein n=1 Tax=Nocardia sp. NPDC057440 TaxID=3346134 RepID=UPI00366FC4A0